MRDAYPLGLLAAPQSQLARIHASSGTTGNPTIGAYTKEDLRIFGEVVARCLAAGGISPGDMFQVAWGYGLFTGGLGGHGGCETLGACAIPASSGNTARQIQLLCDLPVVGIGCTPSYALVVAERIRAEKRTTKALRYAICGAEAWTREMRGELEELLGVTATNIYGLTEIIGPGVAQECLEKQGMHVQEDHFLIEIIDPDTGAPLADGERGELVITTLTREAMPVLRYRTRDLTSMAREKCACGRTTARIDWFTGRVDDMLVIRGVNVFPSAIEEVLLRFTELSPNYRIFVDRPPNGLDAMMVEVEHHPEAAIDDLDAFTRTRERPAGGDAAGVARRARRRAGNDRADRGRQGQARHRPEDVNVSESATGSEAPVVVTERPHEHVALVRLNRPKVFNALSNELLERLAVALETVGADGVTRAVVITGETRAFAAGADIAEFAGEGPRLDVWDRLWSIELPTIAAVNGLALGGGLELAMSCDLMIVADDARLGQPEINLGVMPGAGGTQRLTRAIGKTLATEMVLLGRELSGREAELHGLANRSVPPERVLPVAIELARAIAKQAPQAVRAAKRALARAFEGSLHAGLLDERRAFYGLLETEDAREGIAAFLGKRKPAWSGR